MTDRPMKDRLSKAEIRKDAVQNAVEAAAGTVEQVAKIVTGAVKETATAVGGLATEMFEIRDAARKASKDNAAGIDAPATGDSLAD